MHRAYEAVCENGRLEWTGERPDGERHRMLVTVLDEASTADEPSATEEERLRQPPKRSSEEVRRILDETRGAWGSKFADEVDREIRETRKEWEHPWYPEAKDE